MQSAETVLGVLRERGRRGLPCDELYRQLFNPQLYLLAYGRIYANKGAMTPGVTGETVDGMSLGKIGRIIDAMRHERYRFSPVRRIHIPKKNGKMRPLGLPTWSDKLVGEVVRLLLEAYYEPTFSDRSHGFRPGRGCHTALARCGQHLDRDDLVHRGATSPTASGLLITSHGRILAEKIHDNRFLRLVRNMLKPDTWRTGSGMPRSAVCRKVGWRPRSCPISTCIGWTTFVETVLIPRIHPRCAPSIQPGVQAGGGSDRASPTAR